MGQSEVLVSDITDVFLFLKIIGGGDELQGIKRGIMEMVDLIFINKVDEANSNKAKSTKQELLRALFFMPEKEKGWKTPVLLGSALNNQGLEEVFEKIQDFISLKIKNNSFSRIREQQAEKRFEYWVQQLILQKTRQESAMENSYERHKKNASELKSNPSTEAKLFVEKLFKSG